MSVKKSVVVVLGAGSFGTAAALHVAKTNVDVILWGRDLNHIKEIEKERCNQRYLPNIYFPDNLKVTHDLTECLSKATDVIIAVPSNAFASLLNKLDKPPINGITWLTKGIDPKTHKFLSDLVFEKWGSDFPISILSGPSFAIEIAENLPTAVVLASNNKSYQKRMRTYFHHDFLRVYDSSDIIGVQWCGVVKNIIAIACGISDGLKFGANTKAAVITRGLLEMTRMGLAFGAKHETFMGLAGVGDLVLTCTDDKSRNRRFGLYIGQGMSTIDAEKKINQVVEGRHNVAQVCALADEVHIDMPICQEVNAVLLGKITAIKAVQNLMMRPVRDEYER